MAVRVDRCKASGDCRADAHNLARGHNLVFVADASASHPLDSIPACDVHDVITRLISLYGAVTTTRSWIKSTSPGSRARARSMTGKTLEWRHGSAGSSRTEHEVLNCRTSGEPVAG